MRMLLYAVCALVEIACNKGDNKGGDVQLHAPFNTLRD